MCSDKTIFPNCDILNWYVFPLWVHVLHAHPVLEFILSPRFELDLYVFHRLMGFNCLNIDKHDPLFFF